MEPELRVDKIHGYQKHALNVKGSKPGNERREAVGPDSGRLYETPSSSLSINFFESFILLPLLDDTQGRKQQA